MESAKISNRNPLKRAKNSVLKPKIRQMAKITSAAVAIKPRVGIMDSGNQGLSIAVYAKKLSQLPHTEIASGHMPNRSATADKKLSAMANLKNIFIVLFIAILFDINHPNSSEKR